MIEYERECQHCDDDPEHEGPRRVAHLQHDGYGIPLGWMCEPCLRRRYRSDIMERYETDEPIEPEEEVGYGW